MAYEFHHLSPELILITWIRYPTLSEEKQFLKEHTEQLKNADLPLYFISDLRQGRVITLGTINKMSQLAKHENYGGGTAFSKDPISKIMVKSFRILSSEASEKAAMFDTVEEALSFLESLKPDITNNIDWDTIIAPN